MLLSHAHSARVVSYVSRVLAMESHLAMLLSYIHNTNIVFNFARAFTMLLSHVLRRCGALHYSGLLGFTQ